MPLDGQTFKNGSRNLRPQLTPTSKNKLYAQNLGKKAKFEGGGLLGKSRYRRQMQDDRVARVLQERGYNVIGKPVTFYAMVPGLSYTLPKYQSSAVISSVTHKRYLKYMDKVGAWFRFDADRGLGLRTFTCHALPSRLPVGVNHERASKAIQQSRKLFNAAAKTLHMAGWSEAGFQIVLLREEHSLEREGNFRDFVHYHCLFTAKRRSPKFREFLADFRAKWQSAHATLRDEFPDLFEAATPFEPYLWSDRVKEVESTSSYMAKPVDVPDDLDDDGIEWLHLVTRRRPQFKAYGDFSEWCRELESSGDKVERIDGYYRRITKCRPSEDGDDDYPVLSDDDDYPRLADLCSRPEDGRNDASATPTEARQEAVQGEGGPTPIKPMKASNRAHREATNVLCGPTTPRAGPDGHKESFFVVSNASDGFFDDLSAMERDMSVKNWRAEAREIWEWANGKPFSVREYLRPRAAQIWAWSHHQDESYRAQIQVSNDILGICRSILEERGKLQTYGHVEYDQWHGMQTSYEVLAKGAPPPF